MWLSSRVNLCMEENADHRGRDNPAPKPLKDVPCRIRTIAIRLSGQVLDQWSRSLKCRKQVEKIRILYISLGNIRWVNFWWVRKRERFWVPFRTLWFTYLGRDATWSVSVWNKRRTNSAQVVGGKFPWLQESHETRYFNGDKMASGGDIQHFPALNRVDERQNNRAAYFQPFFQRREELSL